VKWKVELYSNDARNKSPILESLSIEYTEPDSYPSADFLAAQDSVIKYGVQAVKPVQKVELFRSDTNARIDITGDVMNVVNIVQEIPSEPNEFASLFLDSVSVDVENVDKYYSEKNILSPFYNRNYLSDEIRFYSGFNLSGTEEYVLTGRFVINSIQLNTDASAQIYCRSILCDAADKVVGLPVDGIETPKKYLGIKYVKEIMQDLLVEEAGIPLDKIHIEDYQDRFFSNILLVEANIAETLQQLAQACGGVVYTNNQGDVIFKTFDNLVTGSLHFQESTNVRNIEYTGQNRDRIVRECIIKGKSISQVQGTVINSNLDFGKTLTIENEFIEKSEWAEEIAQDVIDRFSFDQSTLKIYSSYLPSVNILDTVKVSSSILSLDENYYFVYKSNKSITKFDDEFELCSNFAVEP
jgi:hypothetical protein